MNYKSFTRLWKIGAALVLVGCTSTINKSSVQATPGVPETTQVAPIYIHYDPALPHYVVTVQPLTQGAGKSGAPMQKHQQQSYNNRGFRPWDWGVGDRLNGNPAPEIDVPTLPQLTATIGHGMAAQLVSALGNAGNITVIDYEHFLRHQDDPTQLLRTNEIGPIVIKGVVTEFNEIAEINNQRHGVALGWAGAIMGIAGGIAGSRDLAYAGAGISAANPTWEQQAIQRTGSVAMDLQLIDPVSGRLFGSIIASGSFVSKSASSGLSLFGIGGGGSAFAASSIGQATRAALNDAVLKINQKFVASSKLPSLQQP